MKGRLTIAILIVVAVPIGIGIYLSRIHIELPGKRAILAGAFSTLVIGPLIGLWRRHTGN